VSYPNAAAALKQYRNTDSNSVSYESPHRLVQMLMEGALDRISMAKGHMSRGETSQKGSAIGRAIAIIDGLRMSLDLPAGGDIARNLDDLYEYMGRTLVEANMNDDASRLDEVARLLGEIKFAWDQIGEQAVSLSKRTAQKTAAANMPVIG